MYETLLLLTLGLGSALAPLLVSLLGSRLAIVVAGLFVPALLVPAREALARIDHSVDSVLGRKVAVLRGIHMFAQLGEPELERIAAALAPVEASVGDTVVEQGADGDRFYVIVAGRAAVEIDGRRRGELGPGDFFGEIALLRQVPRMATVRALDALCLYALDRGPFISAVTAARPGREAADRVIAARLA